MGLPDWIRKKIWMLIISNEAGISENLFNAHLKNVDKLNFEEIEKSSEINVLNGDKSIKIKQKLHLVDDPILNEMINDIIRISDKFSGEIKESNFSLEQFKQDLFLIVRVFSLFRPDITYSKQLVYIATILRLNSEDYYSAFVNLINFTIPSFILRFLIRDEHYVNIYYIYF
jgi:hypothetical protein